MKALLEKLNQAQPCLLYFYTQDSPAMQGFFPILKQVRQHFGNQVTFIELEASQDLEVFQYFHVNTVPALIICKKGLMVWRENRLAPLGRILHALHQFSFQLKVE